MVSLNSVLFITTEAIRAVVTQGDRLFDDLLKCLLEDSMCNAKATNRAVLDRSCLKFSFLLGCLLLNLFDWLGGDVRFM